MKKTLIAFLMVLFFAVPSRAGFELNHERFDFFNVIGTAVFRDALTNEVVMTVSKNQVAFPVGFALTGDLTVGAGFYGTSIFLDEQADADADQAGKGQIWVNLATPNELWFTDDAGTDFQLGIVSGAAGGDLTGTYPNPTLATNSVSDNEIDFTAVTCEDITTTNCGAVTLATADITITAGDLYVGVGCTAITPNGEDLCVDGDVGVDGALTVTGGLILDGAAFIDPRAYANFKAAVAACTNHTLTVNNAVTLDANTIIAAGCSLAITESGSIAKASTYTLAINGPFQAGLYTVFTGFSAGDITFGRGAPRIFPHWFGADGSGVSDSTSELQTALDSVNVAYGSIVDLNGDTFLVSSTITFNKDNCTIDGGSRSSGVIKADSDFTPVFKIQGGSGTEKSFITLKNLRLRSNDTTAHTVLFLEYAQNIFIDNVYITSPSAAASTIGVELGVGTTLIFIYDSYLTSRRGISKTTTGASSGNLFFNDNKFEFGGIYLVPSASSLNNVQINDNSFTSLLGSEAGIYFDASSAAGRNVVISGNTLASIPRQGIYLDNIADGSVIGNSIFSAGTETTNTYDGIYQKDNNSVPLIGNAVVGSDHRIGINQVSGNLNCPIIASPSRSANTAAIVGTQLTLNTNADQTPSVLDGQYNSAWKTETNGVTLTDFTDGYAGQIIYIVSKGDIVFDTTSSNLKGSSVNITTATGDTTTWLCEDGTTWRLLSWIDVSKDNSTTT